MGGLNFRDINALLYGPWLVKPGTNSSFDDTFRYVPRYQTMGKSAWVEDVWGERRGRIPRETFVNCHTRVV